MKNYNKNYHRPGEVYSTTTNSAVYNTIRKRVLEKQGLIYCDRCPYHRGENETNKYYGQLYRTGRVRHPSWKLTSKNPKQWMDKGVKISNSYNVGDAYYCYIYDNDEHIEITF